MEFVLSVVALVVAVVALGLTLLRRPAAPVPLPEPDRAWEPGLADLRREVDGLRTQLSTPRTDPELAALRQELAAARQDLGETRQELANTRRELSDLRATVDAPPPPPLPKARTGALDDLRAQLKAAQQAAADEEDEELP